MARFFGLFLAVTFHAVVIVFGGILFLRDDDDKGTLQEVDLVSAEDVKEDKKEEKKDEPKPSDEELTTEEEPPPDAAELMRNLELAPLQAQPELEAASLGAIADALNGLGAGNGDFGNALSFSSGGRIGGTGKAGALEETLGGAFSLSEIDQKPRVIFQAAPLFPSEMRGKKVEGEVSVLFIVDAGGKVTDPRVEKSSHPAFEKPALDAVRQWKFEPAVKGGKRVPCKMRQPFRFQQPT
jgi:protein TonB